MTFQHWSVIEPYLDIRGDLLEGPYYTASRNEFRFVDLDQEKVYFLDLAKGPGSLKAIPTPSAIGVTADVVDSSGDDSQIVVAAKHGLAMLDRQTGALSYVQRMHSTADDAHRMRFNDGAVDSQGRFWAGSTNDHKVMTVKDEGILYRLDSDLSLHAMVKQMIVPNGMGWNNSDDVFYLTDTPRGTIFAYDFDAATGSISNRRDFFSLDSSQGGPDGFAMDVEGCLWVALWRGSKVLRINPQAEIIGEISLPTRFVTCPEFVGTELFITTALEREPDSYPESARWGGKVYRVDVGIQGKPRNKFRWNNKPKIIDRR